jgi:molybdopterin synthase sulfur carrier subunit
MNVNIQIPSVLRRHTGGQGQLTVVAANLSELVDRLGDVYPDLKHHLRDEAGQLRRFINFYVNDEDIRFLGNHSYHFQEGDEVLIVPSISGGTAESG